MRKSLRLSFLFWKIVPCQDLNPGPPGEKQMTYQCATVLLSVHKFKCLMKRQISHSIMTILVRFCKTPLLPFWQLFGFWLFSVHSVPYSKSWLHFWRSFLFLPQFLHQRWLSSLTLRLAPSITFWMKSFCSVEMALSSKNSVVVTMMPVLLNSMLILGFIFNSLLFGIFECGLHPQIWIIVGEYHNNIYDKTTG